MKVVILAGGFGTRISEESVDRPKPMVEIGGKPILWHIMKHYSTFGFNDFVIALGYKGEVIKNHFLQYNHIQSNFTINTSSGKIDLINKGKDNFNVTLFDTGLNSMTGGRLFNLKEYLKDEDEFMLTYGDGVSNINIDELIKHHRKTKATATLTAVRPSARFGNIKTDDMGKVTDFMEKPQTEQGWINGGFFVFSKAIFNYLSSSSDVLEKYPLETLASEGRLSAFEHKDYWQCMDTVRDKNQLNELWINEKAPWKTW